jgi:hypothetical protein
MQSRSESTSGLERFSIEDVEGSKTPSSPSKGPLRSSGWSHLVSFFSSAVFFLSTFCAIFSPLPILFLFLRRGRKWAWLAAVTNSLVVGWAAGLVSFSFYFVFVLVLALTLPELLNRKWRLEKITALTLLAMALSGFAWVAGYAYFQHVNPIQEAYTQIHSFVDYLGQSISANSALLSPAELEERKQSLITEFPSALAIFSLIMVWTNLVLLLKVNPNGIREKLGLDIGFFKKWKAPEFLVWPTILTGFFLVVQVPTVSDVALNFFNFIMTIYAIQGLSIMSFGLDRMGIRGIFRLMSYLVALGLMMPLVLGLGFFDLWFDFRNKFRQS